MAGIESLLTGAFREMNKQRDEATKIKNSMIEMQLKAKLKAQDPYQQLLGKMLQEFTQEGKVNLAYEGVAANLNKVQKQKKEAPLPQGQPQGQRQGIPQGIQRQLDPRIMQMLGRGGQPPQGMHQRQPQGMMQQGMPQQGGQGMQQNGIPDPVFRRKLEMTLGQDSPTFRVGREETYGSKTNRELAIFQRKEQIKEEVFQNKEEIKQISAARKDLDKYSSDASQAVVAIDNIEKLSKSLPKFERGFGKQLVARTKMYGAEIGKDKNVTRYLGVISQELIPAARKLMEEKGPITETDVERVEKGLGDITTPLEDKIFLLEQLRNKVRQSINNKMNVAGLDEKMFAQKYKVLHNKLFKNQKQEDTIQTSTGQQFIIKQR